jgi:protein-tyrosine sulfotransferase
VTVGRAVPELSRRSTGHGCASAEDSRAVLNAPVIVLTHAYAGAEKLQSMLAGDPTLACTSATGVLPLCEEAAETWRRAEGRPQDALSTLASSAIRGLTGSLLTAILARSGATRWCEVSVAPPETAETYLRLYPYARFICLYRACPDVIQAVLRAHPWSLADTVFRPFATSHPASPAAAVAAYWSIRTAALLAFEDKHSGACLRVRYEDLARDPSTCRAVFAHAGLPDKHLAFPPGPRTQVTLRADGPDVGKLDNTASIPAGVVPPPLLTKVNHLLARLGYPPLV